MSDFATLLRHNTTKRLPTPGVVSVVTRLRVYRSAVRILTGGKDLFQNCPDSLCAPPNLPFDG